MKHLNNKGYMLVEIILASVLAMVVAYFVIDLTIKLKNKNDDLLVKTLVSTDQTIIYNTIMKDLYNDSSAFNCDDIKIDGNVFKYKDFTNIITKYASVGTFSCNKDGDVVSINIPIIVKQLDEDRDFSVNINNSTNNSTENDTLNCKIIANNGKINAETIYSGSDIVYSGWDSNMSTGNGVKEVTISDIGTYTYYVKDSQGNVGNCSVEVTSIGTTKECPSEYTECSSGCECYKWAGKATEIKTYKGTCTCRDPDGSSGGHYEGALCDSTKGCDCPAGLVPRTSCEFDLSYSCSDGTLNKNNLNCYYYKKYETTIGCSEGYNKLNDNYCYKIK